MKEGAQARGCNAGDKGKVDSDTHAGNSGHAVSFDNPGISSNLNGSACTETAVVEAKGHVTASHEVRGVGIRVTQDAFSRGSHRGKGPGVARVGRNFIRPSLLEVATAIIAGVVEERSRVGNVVEDGCDVVVVAIETLISTSVVA